MNAERRVYQMTLQKYELFKSQNPETGRFDVIFEVEGKLLYAHRNMLTLISDTFDSMLSERWTTKDEPIKIKDYSYDNFYQFLTFLYSGECELTDSNIDAMVDIAEFYGVEIFKAYCDEFLAGMPKTLDNIFSLMELADKYSMVELKSCLLAFIIDNFQSFTDSDGFFNASKDVVKDIIYTIKDEVRPEDLFQSVFEWSEKQSMKGQLVDPNLNLNDQIKAEITDFLPNIHFCEMDLDFLLEFVVPKGFIFSSFDELSKILCDFKVTNNRGQTLHGYIIPDKTALKNIESLKLLTCSFGNNICCCRNTKFNLPTTPSPLKERDGIEWYLIYYSDRRIGVEHLSVYEDEYVLAQLISGSTGFETAEGCKIEIE